MATRRNESPAPAKSFDLSKLMWTDFGAFVGSMAVAGYAAYQILF